uniref:Fibrous sheath-interacting protein 2 n=1 Tax=Anopheles farauti TaxID=69004 RepID=A0A9I3GJG7_9DIPT
MSKFLTLRRPTTISKLIQLVPQHANALPSDIVPQWIDLLPSSKIPYRCCPIHAIEFSRGALNQTLWEFPYEHGFDLQDPHTRVVQRIYHELHDKHLHKFWNEAHKKNLLRRGLINRNERVTCTLLELNRYRSFLYQHYCVLLQKRLQEMSTYEVHEHHCLNIQRHLHKNDDFCEKLAIRRTRAADIYNKKMNHWKTLLENYTHRVRDMVCDKDTKRQQSITEGHHNDLRNKKRYADLLSLRKKRILVLKRKLRERDALLKQRLDSNKRRSLEIRNRMQIEHYRLHYNAALTERNENLKSLETYLQQIQHRVSARKDMYKRQHLKLQEDLVKRKARNLAKKYERRNRTALTRALLKAYQKRIRVKHTSKINSIRSSMIEGVINAANTIHATMSPTTSSTQIIDMASQFVMDLRDIPEEPLPQDKIVKRYVKDRLSELMDQIVHTSVHEACKLIEQVAIRKSESISKEVEESTGSVACSNQKSMMKFTSLCTRSVPKRSRVSMGPVSIVEHYESECFTLKKCKFRPPTPVTSVTSLVECALQQSEEERSSCSTLEVSTAMALDVMQRIQHDSYPLFHIMLSHRRYLEGNLLKYRMILQPYVDRRVLAALDLNTFSVTSSDSNNHDSVQREDILQQTACGLLNFPVNSTQYAQALVDSVRFLSKQAIRKIQHKLNEP